MLKTTYKAKEAEYHEIQARYSLLRNDLFHKLKDEVRTLNSKYPQLEAAGAKAASMTGFNTESCFNEYNVSGVTVFELDTLEEAVKHKHFTWEELE